MHALHSTPNPPFLQTLPSLPMFKMTIPNPSLSRMKSLAPLHIQPTKFPKESLKRNVSAKGGSDCGGQFGVLVAGIAQHRSVSSVHLSPEFWNPLSLKDTQSLLATMGPQVLLCQILPVPLPVLTVTLTKTMNENSKQ